MKTDFSINVNVSLGVTPEVIALVGTILSKKPVPVVAEQQPSKDDHQEDAPQAPQKKPNGRSSKTAKAEQEQQPSGEETAPGKTEDNADSGNDTNDTNDTKDEAQAQTQEQQPPVDKAPASKFPTAADLRKAMNDLRDRIEGEDYANKKNTDDKVKALHRLVTSTLKNVAALFGAEKPSEIEEDKRQAFMDEIALLELSSDGSKLEKPLAF